MDDSTIEIRWTQPWSVIGEIIPVIASKFPRSGLMVVAEAVFGSSADEIYSLLSMFLRPGETIGR